MCVLYHGLAMNTGLGRWKVKGAQGILHRCVVSDPQAFLADLSILGVPQYL
jgi:hypothetical protein